MAATAATAATASAAVHLVAIPYPGRGHINPMLHLSEHLLSSSPHLTITFVVTEEWLDLLLTGAGEKPDHWYVTHDSIHLRTIPNVVPSEHKRGEDFTAFLDAVVTNMESPVENLVSRLGQPPPTAIVADSYLPWAVSVGERLGVPVYSLFPMEPSVFWVFYHYDDSDPSSEKRKGKGGSSLEVVPGVTSDHLVNLGTYFTSEKIMEVVVSCFSAVRKAKGLIFNTFDDFEHHVIGKLKTTLPFPVYTVGPLIPFKGLINHVDGSDYFSWLDAQPVGSVLYVSLGSFVRVSGEQIKEMVLGLRDTKVRFLWVARNDHFCDIDENDGMVVSWCDQLGVLCHPAVGGFMTHAGWNSTLESVFAGKPMVTFPQAADQPSNSWLVGNEWKIGVRVRENLCFREGRVDGVVSRKEIARAVRTVMGLDGDGEGSRNMRRRVGLLREKCLSAVADGGSSAVNLSRLVDAFDSIAGVSE